MNMMNNTVGVKLRELKCKLVVKRGKILIFVRGRLRWGLMYDVILP